VSKIIQKLALTWESKKAFNHCSWQANNLTNKSNIPKAVEKSDDHVFSTLIIALIEVFGVCFYFMIYILFNLN